MANLQPVKPILVDTPGEAQSIQKGFVDNLWLGVRKGFRENTIGLLSDMSALQNAKFQSTSGIPKEEWNPNHPMYVEGLEWFEGLNYDIIRRAHDSVELAREMDLARRNSTNGSYSGQFIGMFGGAILDPINLIPLPAAKFASTFLGKAATVGALNAGIETALYPVIKDAYRVRGQKYGFEEAVTGAAFAFAGGSLLYGGFAGLSRGMRAMNFGPQSGDIASAHIRRQRQQASDFTLDQTTSDLINRNKLDIRENAEENIRDMSFTAKDVDSFYIDTTGRVFRELEEGANITTTRDFVELRVDQTGRKVLRGPTEALLKVAQNIQSRSLDDVNFRLEDTQTKKTIDGDKQAVAEFVRQESKLINNKITSTGIDGIDRVFGIEKFKPELDNLNKVYITRDAKYEIQPDREKGIDLENDVGDIFRVENGQRTKITDLDNRKAVIEELRNRLKDERGVNVREDVGKERVADEFNDQNLQPNKTAVDTETQKRMNKVEEKGELDAQRPDEDIGAFDNATTTRQTYLAKLRRNMTQDQLKNFGLEIRADDLVDVGDIDPRLLNTGIQKSDLLAMKNRIKKAHDDLKQKEIEEQEKRSYMICRTGG
jgi:hypothetical protein